MPSANIQTTEPLSLRCPVLWAYHNNNVLALNIDLEDGIKICNFNDKSRINIDMTITDLLTPNICITSIKFPTNNNLKFQCLVAKSGTYEIHDIEIDLESKEATDTLIDSLSASWINGWGHLHRAVTIGNLLIVTDDNGYAHYINLDDLTTDDWDTGSGNYSYRPGFTYVFRKDDIYMLAGRHLSGDPAYLWKIYGKNISSLAVTDGDGSPAPNSVPALFYNDILFMFNWADVIDADNDIALFDIAFNELGKIDLGNLTGWSSNYASANMIIAKTIDGKYYSIVGVGENKSSGNNYRIYFVEHDRNGTIIDSTLLHEILNSSWQDGGYISCSPAYARAYSLPLVDLRTKKVYMLGSVSPDGISTGYFIEIDLSDIWDNIAEWNKNLWFINPLRLPTVLTLNVRIL